MKFNENHKTALSKVLSDLVQCDGIVNQGEIDFLHRVNEAFGITSASRKKATSLILSDAVGILKTLGDREKNILLCLFQSLSLADNNLSPNESLLITALLTSLDMQLEATTGIKAHLVSIPHLDLDTSNAVLYVGYRRIGFYIVKNLIFYACLVHYIKDHLGNATIHKALVRYYQCFLETETSHNAREFLAGSGTEV